MLISAEVLAEAGYRTGMVGKWHLGVGLEGEYLPLHHGFSHYTGTPYSHDICPFISPCYPGQDCDAASPHPLTAPCPLYTGAAITEQPVTLTSLTQRMADSARQFIASSAAAQLPFLLYYSFNHVHFPQFSGAMFRNSSRGGSYGDSVAEMDWAVGEVLGQLQEEG